MAPMLIRRHPLAPALAVLLVLASCAEAEPSPTAEALAATPGPSATARPSPVASSTAAPTPAPTPTGPLELSMQTFPVPAGTHPHDVAPAADGGVWYTAQATGRLGWLDPATGETLEVPLGAGSAPHGVIVGPDDAPWITDGGLNAIVRVDPATDEVRSYPLPAEWAGANLNTATFDGDGVLWFTGQSGVYGRLNPDTGEMAVHPAPLGRGPYGIGTTPDGEVYFGSLAGSYLGAVDRESGEVTVIDTPDAGGGARRVWSDSSGRLWVTEWFAGNLAVHDPADGSWRTWRLPGESPMPYAVFVDETDAVWVTDFGANAIVRFDPATEEFTSLVHDSAPAEVRQLLGRAGEVWGAESAADQLVVVRIGS